MFKHVVLLLHLNLIPPHPAVVECREAVHNDRNRQLKDEHAAEGTQASDEFSQESLRVDRVAARGDVNQR